MTVREMAARAGVSAATVSRYLKNPASVNAESRERLDAVSSASGGERPASRQAKRAPVAVLLPHLHYAFYERALRELIEQAPKMGLELVILPENGDADAGLADLLERTMPTAVISLETTMDARAAKWLNAHPNVQTTVLAEKTNIENACMVHIDDMAAAYDGTQYLLSLGHRNICFFSNQTDGLSTSFQRLTGSRKAMSERGLSIDGHVRYGALTYEKGYELGRALAQRERGQYTAVFAFSDEMALGAMTALMDEGLRVPQDISVLGIDDLPIASRVRPQLTTIHQPLCDMATCVLKLATQKNITTHSVVLPHKLMVRGTCRDITSGGDAK